MIEGVAAVWVPVQDMDRAEAFYSDALGLSVDRVDESWAEVDANGLMIGLNAREGEGADSDGGPVITFQPSGDIDEAKRELESRGVEFPRDLGASVGAHRDLQGLRGQRPPALRAAARLTRRSGSHSRSPASAKNSTTRIA